METRKVKKVSFPHTFVIIFVMIVIAVGLTWVVPAGTYDFVKSASGRKVVDPATFHYIQSASVNPLLIPLYIIKSFSKRIDLMMVIFMAGSAFHVVTKTGALQAILAKGAKRFSNRLEVFIPVLTLIFGLICTTQGVNTFIPFAPVMVMLAMAMGLDSITGEAIMVLGGAIGFSTGTFNMFTTVVAQDIAELPAYSGLWYRAVCFVVFYIVTNWYLIRYAKKIKKNPTMSPMFDLDQEMKAEKDADSLGPSSDCFCRNHLWGDCPKMGYGSYGSDVPDLQRRCRSYDWNACQYGMQGHLRWQQANAWGSFHHWDGNRHQRHHGCRKDYLHDCSCNLRATKRSSSHHHSSRNGPCQYAHQSFPDFREWAGGCCYAYSYSTS